MKSSSSPRDGGFALSAALKFAPHYTHKDYVQWMGDWELWEGIAVAMSPSPFGRHQRVVTALAAELLGELRRTNSLATALARLDWIIADDTVVRPDVMVVWEADVGQWRSFRLDRLNHWERHARIEDYLNGN